MLQWVSLVMGGSEKCISFPLYSPLWVVLMSLQKKILRGLWTTGKFGEGSAVKEVRRISNFNYNFTKLKQTDFEEKNSQKMCFYH